MSIKLLSRFKNYAALGLLMLGGGIADAQYCIPTYVVNCTNSANSTWITNFKTTGGVVNINNNSACSDPSSYYYYSTVPCTFNAGSTLNWDITQSKSNWQAGCAIWVDWNNDGIFNAGGGPFVPGGGERMTVASIFFNGLPQPTATAPNTKSFVVPAWVKEGKHRMRVRIQAFAAVPTGPAIGSNPCGQLNNGEVEDYDIYVVNPCLPPGVTSVSNLSDRTATVSWSQRPNADMYEWTLDTSRTDPTSLGYFYTNTSSVNFPNASVPKLECNTKYYFHLRTICDTAPKPALAWKYSSWTLDSFTTDQCCYIPPVTISQVGATSAVATWSAVPSGYMYEYAVGTTGGNPPLTGGTKTNYTSVLLQGLPCNSRSYFYLRALCSPTPYSEWGETSIWTLDCTSVSNIGGVAGGVEAYPNPAKDIVTIKVNGWKNGDGNVTITDLSGKVVRTAVVTTDIVSIHLDGLSPGIYLVKYTDPRRSEVIRINKQ